MTTNEAQIGAADLFSRTLFASFRERQRQNDVAGAVGTRAATSLVVMLSATSGQPLSTDRDNVVGPMILRLTPQRCASPASLAFRALFSLSLSLRAREMIPL